MINLRLDETGENMAFTFEWFCISNVIRLETTPPHSTESNGVAERFMNKLRTRARFLLFEDNLTQVFALRLLAMKTGFAVGCYHPASEDEFPFAHWI